MTTNDHCFIVSQYFILAFQIELILVVHKKRELSAWLNFNYVLMLCLLFRNRIDAIIKCWLIIFNRSKCSGINPRNKLTCFHLQSQFFGQNDAEICGQKNRSHEASMVFQVFSRSTNGVILYNNFFGPVKLCWFKHLCKIRW